MINGSTLEAKRRHAHRNQRTLAQCIHFHNNPTTRFQGRAGHFDCEGGVQIHVVAEIFNFGVGLYWYSGAAKTQIEAQMEERRWWVSIWMRSRAHRQAVRDRSGAVEQKRRRGKEPERERQTYVNRNTIGNAVLGAALVSLNPNGLRPLSSEALALLTCVRVGLDAWTSAGVASWMMKIVETIEVWPCSCDGLGRKEIIENLWY
ncbi:hypothetical protein V8B97DRAFT_2049154 [Scleroderma yunnanense]